MIRSITLFFLSIFFLSTTPQVAHSQTFSLSDTVSITATRFPIDKDETGRFITVIDAEAIAASPANSIDELIRYLPGVEITQRNIRGVQADISIRGSTFTQTIILIDGTRFYSPLTSHFNAYLPVGIDEIARIEVLRGPAAALYGPDAVGGVIHIITKTWLDNLEETGVSANLAGEVGEYGLWAANASLRAITPGQHRIQLNYQHQQADGPRVSSGLRSDFDMYTVSGSWRMKLGNNWDLGLRSSYDERDYMAQFFYTVSSLDSSREETSHWFSHLKLRNRGRKIQNEWDLSFTRGEDFFEFNPRFTPNNHTIYFLNFQSNHIIPLSEEWRLGTGFQADRRWVESTDRGNHSNWHAGAYVNTYARIQQRLNLSLGLRLDYDENYDWELSPQANISYRAGQLNFRAAGGRSIRAADFTERFISYNLVGPLSGGRNIGNPNLEAERAWHGEIGLDWTPVKPIRISSTLFIRNSNNLIDYILTPTEEIERQVNLSPNSTYLYAQNLAEIQTSGIETEIAFQQQIAERSSVFASLGYTYLDTEGQNARPSKYVSNHARHLFVGRVNLRVKAFTWDIQGLWKERSADSAPALISDLEPEYWVWHSKLSMNVLQQFRFSVQVHNIFDAKYQDILGAEMPGRWISAGVRWSFRSRSE